MIRFVKHQDIDPILWDKAVESSATPSVFGTYDLLNVLTGDQNWHAIVEDDYQAVLPLPCRSKFGISYVYPPFFLPQMGIYAKQPVAAEYTLRFFNTIPKKYRQVDLLFNRHNDISLLPENQYLLPSYEVSLQVPYETLWDGFSQNTRRNIKSAEKHFLTIEKNSELVGDIIRLFQNNRGKAEAVHFQERDYQNLIRVADVLLDKGKLEVLCVRDGAQNLIAGALLVRDGRKIWFWFSGRDEKAADSKPMFFLINEFLKENGNTDTVFDFNGSSNENVARFYKGFGGIPYSIPMLQHSRSRILRMLKSR